MERNDVLIEMANKAADVWENDSAYQQAHQIIKMLVGEVSRWEIAYMNEIADVSARADMVCMIDDELRADVERLRARQTPKKPRTDSGFRFWECPGCKEDLMGCIGPDYNKDPAYCPFCGQALDWNEPFRTTVEQMEVPDDKKI